MALTIVPIGGNFVDGGAVVGVEVYFSARRDIRMEGGQIDLPCTVPGGTGGAISIDPVSGNGGATTDPDGDGARGPSSTGIPFLFGPAGLGPFTPSNCRMALTPAIGGPTGVNLTAGSSRYLGTYFYRVEACAEFMFLLDFEMVTHPPVGTNQTRLREDAPLSPTPGPLLDLATSGTELSVRLGRCCSGSRCIGSKSEPCCLEENLGVTWTEGSDCSESCLPCATNNDCRRDDSCHASTCEGGECITRPTAEPCDDGLYCTIDDKCRGGLCVGVEGPCPGQLCNEATDSCVECLANTDCNDDNPCTDDLCREGSCLFTPNSLACNDGLFCTTNDRCEEGRCTGNPRTCGNGLSCHEVLRECRERIVLRCRPNATEPMTQDIDPLHCEIISAEDVELGSVQLDFPCLIPSSEPRPAAVGLLVDTTHSVPSYLFGPLGEVSADFVTCATVHRPAFGQSRALLPAHQPRYLATILYRINTCDSQYEAFLEYASDPPNALDTTKFMDDKGALLPFETILEPIGVRQLGNCCWRTPGFLFCGSISESCCNRESNSYSWMAGATCLEVGCPPEPFNCALPTDCDDGNTCTRDTCISGFCFHAPMQGSLRCDDGIYCNGLDTCVDGQCVGHPDPHPCGSAPCRDDLDSCVDCLTPQECDDSNPCTNDVCTVASQCVHLATADPCEDGLFCTAGDRCANAACHPGPSPCPRQNCDEVRNKCVPADCPTAEITAADPLNGTVDARQPHPLGDATPVAMQGIGGVDDPIVLTLSSAGADGVCFDLCESTIRFGAVNNSIQSVTEYPPGVYRIRLEQPIAPGEAATVAYGTEVVSYISHPGNTDGDEESSAEDVRRLVSHLNGTSLPAHGRWSTDLNHSGALNLLDLMRLMELLLG